MHLGDKYVEYFFSVNSAGEPELDFVLTAKGPAGKVSIAERNIYRYINTGKGLLLLGYSTRSYGDETIVFLRDWKKERTKLTTSFADIKSPKLTSL